MAVKNLQSQENCFNGMTSMTDDGQRSGNIYALAISLKVFDTGISKTTFIYCLDDDKHSQVIKLTSKIVQ